MVQATGASADLQFSFSHNDPTSFFFVDDVSVELIPEPASVGLLGAGLLGVAGFLKRKQSGRDK